MSKLPKNEVVMLIKLFELGFLPGTKQVQDVLGYDYPTINEFLGRWLDVGVLRLVGFDWEVQKNILNKLAFEVGLAWKSVHIHMDINTLLSMSDAELCDTVTSSDPNEDVRAVLWVYQQEGWKYLVCDSTCDHRNDDGTCAAHYEFKK